MQGSRFEATADQGADAISVMGTNKARAQAAQVLLQDCENPVPLLPLDDPSQRISLHRQLRRRYNPSQIPFSTLSCSQYITASDVARLAAVFHEFNLFDRLAAAPDASAPSLVPRSSPMPSASVVAVGAPSAATAPAKPDTGTDVGGGKSRASFKTALPLTAPASSLFSSLLSAVPSGLTGSIPPAASSGWRGGEGVFHGNGMTLLRDVAEPPPPCVVALPASPLPQLTRSTGASQPTAQQQQQARSPRAEQKMIAAKGVTAPLPPLAAPSKPSGLTAAASSAPAAPQVPPPCSTTTVAAAAAAAPLTFPNSASLALSTTTAAAAAMTSSHDLAEPFTAEGDDCALLTEWLVEVLLEMVLENFEAASRKGNAVGGPDESDEGDSAEKKQTGDSAASRRPSARLSRSASATGLNVSMTAAGHSLAATTAATTYQARCCDARLELLVSVKAELLAWAKQLQQTCDQREHLAAWQHCVLQEEVLRRYQLCVVHASRAATVGLRSASPLLPLGVSKLLTHPPDLGLSAGSAAAVMDSGAVSDRARTTSSRTTSPPVSPQRARRASVGWHMFDAAAKAASTTTANTGLTITAAAGELVPETRRVASASLRSTAAAVATPHAPHGIFASSPAQRASSRQLHDGSGLVEVLNEPHGTDNNPATELTHLLEYSAKESTGYDPDTSLLVGGGEAAAWPAAATPLTESTYLASKARMCAPELKDLLLQPTELNSFLWESAAAHRIAKEEEARAQQLQNARSTRSALLSNSTAGVMSLSQTMAGDTSRTVCRSEAAARAPPSPSPPPQRRRRAAAEQHLVCWSDVASNLLMGLETTWSSQQHDLAYVRVPTVLLEDLADGARGATAEPLHATLSSRRLSTAAVAAASRASNAPGQPDRYGNDNDDDDDVLEESQALAPGATDKVGSCRRRRFNKTGNGTDAVSLQQHAMLLSSLDAAAEAALRTLHAQAADHVVVSPSQKYLVTSSKDGMLKVWETSQGAFVGTILNVEKAWVLHLCFLHGGAYLLVATSAAEITVVKFPSGGVVVKLRGCTSLATAIAYVKQPSTVYTQRFGLKPGECGPHRPAAKQGASLAAHHAAKAAQLEKQVESDNVTIAARPVLGYVAPTSAFYNEELGQLFFGTLSGMVGCVDLAEPLSHTGLLAAAAGIRWKGPLRVHSSVYAHPDLFAEHKGSTAATAATDSDGDSNGGKVCAVQATLAADGGSGSGSSSGAAPVGLQVNGVFYCDVGHCVISSDCAGGLVRTPFTAAADTSLCALGTPTAVMDTNRPIRFTVCCPGGRRFVTVHSDRRALLWGVGRMTTELLHQFPQEAYDIVDACFVPHLLQVALLMADRSIHVFDERGTRPIGTIQPPRGFSSCLEDLASVTLKYSANDGEGCLAYVPGTRRLVCGLRGPVLYEPVARAGSLERTVRADDAKACRGSAVANASVALPQLSSTPLSAVASPTGRLPVDPTTPVPAADRRFPRRRSISFTSVVSGTSENSEVGDRVYERVRRQRREQFASALLKAQQRLLPHQTHTSAVVGILLDLDHGELHTISTDTWTTWNYVTGARLRTPVQVPEAAERELALRRRACRLTCAAWSSSVHTRLLLGTRGSRVLTVDAAVGSVVSVTPPLTPPLKHGQHRPLDDKDVSVIACCGTRTLICRGRVCEVRRYELTGTPLPSGEERFVSMQVQLPSSVTASAAPPEPASATTNTKAKATRGRGGPKRRRSPPLPPQPQAHHATHQQCSSGSINSHNPSSGKPATNVGSGGPGGAAGAATTITSCCVVRESYLCVGTSDTQLFFYRMVDHSSPFQVEVLRDVSGEPDVGRVISLHYIYDKTQDMLLAVVDTGAVYIYSYTLQRVVTRCNLPCLGTNLLEAMAAAGQRRGRATATQRPHYLTSVALTGDLTGGTTLAAAALPSAAAGHGQRQLLLCCGDSAGYVHVASLADLFVDAAAAVAVAVAAVPNSQVGPKNRELRVVASFRAAAAGVSALETMWWDRLNASPVEEAQPCGRRATAAPATPSTSSSPVSPATASAAAAAADTPPPSALVVFAGSFDGDVRVLCLLPTQPSSSGSLPRLSAALAAGASTLLSSVLARGTLFALTTAPGPGIIAPTSVGAATLPATFPAEAPSILLSPHSAGDGTTYGPTVLFDEGKGDTTNSNTNDNGGGGGTFFSSVPQLVPALHTAKGLTHTAPALHAWSGTRYAPVTVGLCGVDTWVLSEAETFADVKQAAWLADFLGEQEDGEDSDAEEQARLPTILDDDDINNNGGDPRDDTPRGSQWLGSGSATTLGPLPENGAGSATNGGGDDGGAALLRDVLRRSKKRLIQRSTGGDGVDGGSAAAAAAPGAGTRWRRSSPGLRNGATATTAATSRDDGQSHAPAETPLSTANTAEERGKHGNGKGPAVRKDSGSRIHSAPLSHSAALANEAPQLFKPHTIGELVSSARPSASKELTFPRIGTDVTASATPRIHAQDARNDIDLDVEGPDSSPTAKSDASALVSSLGPQPRPFPFKNQQNPLLRTYPVALLRQMGVLHPQDKTPDIDPVTRQPTQLSAQEAFQWRNAAAAAGSVSGPDAFALEEARQPATAAEVATFAEHSSLSPPSRLTSEAPGSFDAAAATLRPSSTTASSASSSSYANAGRWSRSRRNTAVADHYHNATATAGAAEWMGEGERKQHDVAAAAVVPVAPSSASGDKRSPGWQASTSSDPRGDEEGRRDASELPTVSSADEEGEEMQTSVFLTEGPTHEQPGSLSSARPRFITPLSAPTAVATAGHSMTTTALPAAPSSASSKCDGTCLGTEPEAAVKLSTPNELLTSLSSVSPIGEESTVRWSAAQQAPPPPPPPGGGRTPGETSRKRRSRASRLNIDGSITSSALTSRVTAAAVASGAGLLSPTSTPPTCTRSQRDLVLLRGALQDLDPRILLQREEQMMLSHAAGQLDRELRRPAADQAATARGQSPSSQRGSTSHMVARKRTTTGGSGGRERDTADARGVGEFTARLLRMWRQRSGNAALEASAAVGLPSTASHFSLVDDESFGPDDEANHAAASTASTVTAARRSAGGSVLTKRSSHREPISGGHAHAGKSCPLSRPPSNAMIAAAAARQAAPETGFGLDLFTLTVPSEPPQAMTRRGMPGGSSAALLRAGRSPSATPSRSTTQLLPMVRMQQELHPVRVTLPSTLQKDEGERMWLRRFEALMNERSAKQ